MTREELVQRITDGASYLQQELTPQAREVAESKMKKYQAQLIDLDIAERVKDPPPPRVVTEHVQSYIEAIREMLKPITKER